MTRPTVARVVIDASSSIELEEFEQIEATPGTALLRVAARPSARVASTGASTLVVDDGSRRHRLSALPAPRAPTGLLRAAYSVPLELLGGPTAFALELPDGSVVDLPAPTRRRKPLAREEPSASPGPAPPAESAAVRETQVDAVSVAAARRAQEQAQAEVEAAVRPRPKTRAAEPPQSKEEKAAADADGPRGVREPDAGLVQARRSRAGGPRVSARRRERPARKPRQPPSLPSEVGLGMCLLALGLIVALLILTGAVKVGFAP